MFEYHVCIYIINTGGEGVKKNLHRAEREGGCSGFWKSFFLLGRRLVMRKGLQTPLERNGWWKSLKDYKLRGKNRCSVSVYLRVSGCVRLNVECWKCIDVHESVCFVFLCVNKSCHTCKRVMTHMHEGVMVCMRVRHAASTNTCTRYS